jgi:hypothetical protein
VDPVTEPLLLRAPGIEPETSGSEAVLSTCLRDGVEETAGRGIGLQHFHRNAASRMRRRKGNPMPADVTGPACGGATYIQGLGLPSLGLDLRFTTLLCK